MKESVWVIVIVTMMIIKMARAHGDLHLLGGNLHLVGGGKDTWAPNVNFSEWSTHEHFYVGEWLFFGFDRNKYNVLEVNKTSYENCIETGFINNITKRGRDVFHLTEPRFYYFLSGRGFCQQGMKVSIQVVNDSQPSPSPPQKGPPSASASASGFDNNGRILVLLLSALVCSFFSH